LRDHALAKISREKLAGLRNFVAVSGDDVGGDGAGAAAVVEDGCCGGEGKELVCAFDEHGDGALAGTGGELLVFGGEMVPVFAFGLGLR
jgi:hypothetical protein